jgi:predicted O-methyltransferase YrrM
MTPEVWSAVDNYINGTIVPSDAALDATLKSTKEAGLPEIQVSAPQGKLLHLLARMQKARNILEIGTLAGYSTIWLARTLPPDGHLTTLELDSKHAQVARANIERAGLADRVRICVGPAMESLAQLQKEKCEPFDLVFIDADKPSTPDYFKWALEHSRTGTLIIADNTVRNGGLADANSKDAGIQGSRRFHEILAAEPRVTATTLQTVGGKGYDGLTLAFVIA